MSQSLVRVLAMQPRYTSTGKLSSYSIECFHDGLKEHRELRSSELDVLQNKVHSLLERWEQKWQKVCTRHDKQRTATSAAEATAEAQQLLEDCDQLLLHSLAVDDRVDWEALKQKRPFHWEMNQDPILAYAKTTGEPIKIRTLARPEEPERADARFQPTLAWFDFLLPFLKRKKIETAEQSFIKAQQSYEAALDAVMRAEEYREQLLATQQQEYLQAKDKYQQGCAIVNEKVDALKNAWMDKDPRAIIEHAELVLNASSYPDWCEINFDLNYVADTGLLIVDYQLPAPPAIPTLERVTYVKSRDELVEKHLTEARSRKLFDSVCYQLALRTMHELFEADEPHAIASIVFNGWVEAVSPATGIMQRSCILSVHALKQEFISFDLARVDPRICFKTLKGVAASSLYQITPIRPVILLQRDDPRFVDSYDVADTLDESVNLAAMGWEEFEHLVRELFGKVFSGNGAEVRVTQASRDGGVDAVALDPDPIKGGKIIIQAKRYTATVSVSAVRDLYGTVMNEGANRGILVTTSDFGPDAYKFAAGKPITLLNGSNLLSLLADHGHKAKIDLNEARLAR